MENIREERRNRDTQTGSERMRARERRQGKVSQKRDKEKGEKKQE